MKYVGNRYTNILRLVVVILVAAATAIIVMAVGRPFYAFGGHKIDARGI